MMVNKEEGTWHVMTKEAITCLDQYHMVGHNLERVFAKCLSQACVALPRGDRIEIAVTAHDHVESGASCASRRRLRRLPAAWPHEQQSIAMAVVFSERILDSLMCPLRTS